MASGTPAKTADGIRKQRSAPCRVRRQICGGRRRSRIRCYHRILNTVQSRHICNNSRQLRSRESIRTRLHPRIRNSSTHHVTDVSLIEAPRADSRRASPNALRAVAVSIRAGLVEYVLTLLENVRQVLRRRKAGQKKQKEDRFHFTPSGSANTISV